MRKSIWALLGLAFVPQVLAADTLSTDGFDLCMTDSDITVTDLDVTYTRSTKEVVFDLAGTNSKEQNVTATLKVTAYGNTIYTKTFNPCGSDVHVAELCPGKGALQGVVLSFQPADLTRISPLGLLCRQRKHDGSR